MKRPYLNQEQRQLIRMNTLQGDMCALDLEYKKLLREVELTIKNHTNENTRISGRKV